MFPVLEHRLRHACIEAAVALCGGAATDSKVSIVTGLQRRDIARLRRETAPSQNQRQPLAEIIARWSNDPDHDPKGIPVNGDGASFATLARGIRKDVHPRTFLDVLIENGAVTEIDGRVILNTRSYQPLAGSDDQLAYLADNVGDHLASAVSNVVDGARNYDMGVHYRGLSAKAIKDLETQFRTRMSQTLNELDTMARAMPAAEDGPYRFRAGGYFFDDVDTKEKQDDP
ncbi:MAG: DUF6502 family protein [Rhodobacter sp.]|nr:DUF6502 family protein [Rhodobacter sp.]